MEQNIDNQQQNNDNKLRELTDVELCCATILTFYHFPKQPNLLFEEIYSHLSRHYIVEKQRLQSMLRILEKQWLVTYTFKFVPDSTCENGRKITEEYWLWSIRMDVNNEHEGHPYHSTSL